MTCRWCGRPLDMDGEYCKACADILIAFSQIELPQAEQIAKDAAAGCELAKRVQGEAFMMIQTDRTDAFMEAYKAWLSKEVPR